MEVMEVMEMTEVTEVEVTSEIFIYSSAIDFSRKRMLTVFQCINNLRRGL